jgi:hypothetical protein
MVNAKIDIFKISYEESVSYVKKLENLEKIRCTNHLIPASIPVGSKKKVSVTRSVGNSPKNHKLYNMWCHYCDKNKHNTADCREIAKFKNTIRLALKANLDPGRSLWPSFSKTSMHSKDS